MKSTKGLGTAEARVDHGWITWAPVVIGATGLAAYANSFSGPFVFDDLGSIVGNQSLRHLWPLTAALAPPGGGITVSGRPILNLTLAANYAIGGVAVAGYHWVNLAIHILAGLTLWGIARRTLPAYPRWAFFLALLWTVHPLQTESVTYVIQRAQSLMGLLYFLTLYCSLRYFESVAGAASRIPRAGFAGLAVVCCVLGMGSKEDMVSAPLTVLFYDRAFVAGSFRSAWARRRGFYAALAASWIFLGWLVLREGGDRAGSMGFSLRGPWYAYGLTQFRAIPHYLGLAFWPHPLVFEYGTVHVAALSEVLPGVALVVVLAAATIVALVRWPSWGFAGFWFWAMLAPTSLVTTATQMIVEHRLYVALAPLLGAALFPVFFLERKLGDRTGAAGREAGRSRLGATLLLLVAGIFAGLTAARNRDYRSAEALWADTVAKRPDNALAHNNLGTVLEKLPGRLGDAIAQYQAAVELNPGYVEAHTNLGNAWLKRPGQEGKAIAEYQTALRLDPTYAEAHNNLGNALERQPGQSAAALAHYEAAVQLKPNYVEAHVNLGSLLAAFPSRQADALAHDLAALRLDPGNARAHNNLGNLWVRQPGQLGAAVAQYQAALQSDPRFAEAHNDLGNAWAKLPGKQQDAILEYQAALRLKPDYAEAHYNLGNCWAQLPGHTDEAIAEYLAALRLRPDYAEACNNLGNVFSAAGRLPEAIDQYQAAVRLQPGNPAVHFNLALALLKTPAGTAAGLAELEATLRLQPDNATARAIETQVRAALP